MPLRIRRREGSSFLWLVGTIEGRRIRESTGTADPKLAEVKRAAREAELFKAAALGIRPTVPFSKAADSYLKASKPGNTHRKVVERLVKVLGARPTRAIDQLDCDRARDALCRPDAAAATIVRNVVSPLTSILRHASRRGYCDWPRFEWPDIADPGFSFFTPAQAEALIQAVAPHVAPIITFMLATGVRSGEALLLDWGDVDLAGARVMLWEGTTKTGKRRVVHLNPRALATLANMPTRDGRVFRRDDGEPYALSDDNRGVLRSAWNTACFRAGLPGVRSEPTTGRKGPWRTFKPQHTPHDCRHTYATWHYAIHKDMLMLAHDVGWHSVKMAERYAHVMPAGHRAAICEFWGIADPILTQRIELSA